MTLPKKNDAFPACPMCKKPVGLRKTNPSFPFCSPRCRAVDLGKWLGEEYRVPDAHPEDLEDGLPDTDFPPKAPPEAHEDG